MYSKATNLLQNYQPGIRGHISKEKQQYLRSCSVLIPLVQNESQYEEISLLLIRRSHNLRRNPGEYAFPGGMFEEQDRENPYHCALREWHEEMGSSKPHSTLGLLDDFLTLSGLKITPVVCWFKHQPVIRISQQEVQEVLYIPLNFFQSNNRQIENIQQQGVQFQSDTYCWQGRRIWGATAGIITNLIEVLSPLIK